MKYNLPERVIRDISTFAKKHSVEKVILFGSRARGTNTERSDIDIAVYGGDFDSFYWDIKEKVHSLLMFDVVEIDAGISEELRKEIKKDGVVIYEKAWKFFELLKCTWKNIAKKTRRNKGRLEKIKKQECWQDRRIFTKKTRVGDITNNILGR